jgi:hypothetical protein
MTAPTPAEVSSDPKSKRGEEEKAELIQLSIYLLVLRHIPTYSGLLAESGPTEERQFMSSQRISRRPSSLSTVAQ